MADKNEKAEGTKVNNRQYKKDGKHDAPPAQLAITPNRPRHGGFGVCFSGSPKFKLKFNSKFTSPFFHNFTTTTINSRAGRGRFGISCQARDGLQRYREDCLQLFIEKEGLFG